MEITKTKAIIGASVMVVMVVGAGLIGHFATPQTECASSPSATTHPTTTATTKAPATTTTTEAPVTTTEAPTIQNYRLPTSVEPLHYRVWLQPFINGNRSIMGNIDIEVKIVEETSSITLHMADIILDDSSLKLTNSADQSEVDITSHEEDTDREFLIVHVNEMLPVNGEFVLSMSFEAYLNGELRGFYMSTYEDVNGKVIRAAATQFQPTDARRAFPCFDEPALKAQFTVSLARQDNMTSISNMPIHNKEPVAGQPGWEWDHYNTSVKMSTYLVAFIISDFVHETDMAGPTEFSVWTRPEAIHQANYSLDVGVRCLNYFETYFDIPYPLPKQDMVAMPDFAAGAMENWGLILYRETAMLYEPGISGASNKQRVAVVVVHELAHQWFGNLVTPTWWTDLWLNEGFASFMEFIGVDEVEPTWRMMEQFVVDTLHYVFGIDSLESSHPISIPVGHPDEINEIFDAISYYKGASIIRMMYFFLTEATFKKGLTNYLNHFEYDAAEQDDLWDFLTQAAHQDGTLDSSVTVKDIMDTWTLQMGYPVINVERNSAGDTATVSQEWFRLIKSEDSSSSADYSWWIPLTLTSEAAPNFDQTKPTDVSRWMSKDDKQVTINGLPSRDQWVIFNLQQTGYYRVNYDNENWEAISKQLDTNHQVIHVNNRAQLMDDALNLARAGHLQYERALSLVGYLVNEEEYMPWEAAYYSMSYLEKMFTRTAGYGALKNYMRHLVTSLYEKVGFEDDLNDLHLDQYKRVLALSWACHLGHTECVANSVLQFNDLITNGTEVSPNLKSTVYCTAIAAGDEAEWDAGWQLYLDANVATEKDKFLSALGCTKQIWLLSRYLDMAFDENSGVRRQDARTVFRAVANNDIGRYLAWDYIRDNWDKISNYLGGFTSLGNLISYVTAEFNTQEQLKQLEAFYEANQDNLATAARAFQQAIESTKANIAWMEDNYDNIVTWLNIQ